MKDNDDKMMVSHIGKDHHLYQQACNRRNQGARAGGLLSQNDVTAWPLRSIQVRDSKNKKKSSKSPLIHSVSPFTENF